MKLSLFFAIRYLFSKKSVNAINIISGISIVGVLVSSAALVIVLSFYNGMENLILSLYSTFAPELRIEPTMGKVFDPKQEIFKELRSDPKIASYTEVLEDKVLLQYQDAQVVAQIKGIEAQSLTAGKHQDMLYAGSLSIDSEGGFKALIGAQIQSSLRIPFNGTESNLQLYAPRKGASGKSINPLDDINIRKIEPVGILQFEPGFNDLIITPIAFAKDLLQEQERISAIEIYSNTPNSRGFQKNVQQRLGKQFIVKNREQQNPLLYKTVRSEKWIVFSILTLIGIIAIFNIIGSLTMLVIDKKQDMDILRSLGADKGLIQQIFFLEGIMIACIGGIIGIAIGLIFCLLQERFGFIRTGDANPVMDVYPIDIRAMDFVLVFITVMLVATVVSYISSRLSVRELKRNSKLGN